MTALRHGRATKVDVRFIAIALDQCADCLKEPAPGVVMGSVGEQMCSSPHE
jgi:hypothetical protein